MSSDLLQSLVGYDELGTHRHLVVSERLRIRRRQLGLTQKEVVARMRRLGVGTTNKALSSLEHGAGLDVCKLPEIAQALECTLTYLVGLTADPARWQPDTGVWAGTDIVSAEARAVPHAEPPARSDGPPVDPAAPQVGRPARADAGPWILGPVEPRPRG
jgi:transcriptional regulator with XRE-family HTH domain